MKPYYDDGHGIAIYHGDCRDVREWLAADVLVTDPPYGIAYASGYARELVSEGGDYEAVDGSICGDADTTIRDHVLVKWGDTKPALVFGSMRAPFPARWKQALCWDKGDSAGMGNLRIPWKPCWEPIFVLGEWGCEGRESGVIRATNISRVSMGRCHPHMKPVGLIQALLSRCPDGVVADPFMGSGTTLLAAKLLGRRAFGVEIEEHYCEIAARRLAQEVLPFVRQPVAPVAPPPELFA